MHLLLQCVTLAKWDGSVEAQYPDWSGALVSCRKVRTWPGRLRLASSCKGMVSCHGSWRADGHRETSTLCSQITLGAMSWRHRLGSLRRRCFGVHAHAWNRLHGNHACVTQPIWSYKLQIPQAATPLNRQLNPHTS